MDRVYTCVFCNKECPTLQNYCSWNCMLDEAKAAGGAVNTPNNLPIRVIDFNGDMWEHSHANHPNYKFPVDVEFIGTLTDDDIQDYRICCGKDPLDDEKLRNFKRETHALIYTDGNIALTMFEYNYYIFNVMNGKLIGAPHWAELQRKLCDTACTQIKSLQ